MRLLPLTSLAVVACAAAPVVPRLPPAAQARPFTATRYDVKLTPDFKSQRVHGQTVLHFEPGTEPRNIEFAIPDLDIERVEFSGKPGVFQVANDHLSIAIPAGAQAVEITYQGRAQRGLTFGPDYLYSNYSSCGWMICNDEPGQKAEFDLELEVPKGTVVVASGKWLEDLPGSNPGVIKSHWHQSKGYAPYLFGFAAGAFAKAELGPLRLYGAAETPATLLAKLKDTPRMVDFLTERAGTPLPTPDYAQIVVADEAQEKSTFSLIGKEELDPILTDPMEDWVIVHELAHQWWGNSITCKTWPHFWLNEGITTFMVAAYKEQRWGKAAYEHEFEIINSRYQKAVAEHFDVPLAYSKPYPSLSAKRRITYSKAALFLRALREQMGDEAFWKGFRAYTQARIGTTVESRDFQFELEKATGQDLGAIFKKWVYEADPTSPSGVSTP